MIAYNRADLLQMDRPLARILYHNGGIKQYNCMILAVSCWLTRLICVAVGFSERDSEPRLGAGVVLARISARKTFAFLAECEGSSFATVNENKKPPLCGGYLFGDGYVKDCNAFLN